MIVWLIRHAESEANAGIASRDPRAILLTARGRAQAERAADLFDTAPSLIVMSGDLRTQQTAEPTRRRFPEVPCERWPVQEFTYLGSLHGQLTTAAERRPLVDAYWSRADPHLVDGEGAESFADVVGRARDLARRLRAAGQGPGPVVVFTHGVFMRVVAWCLLAGGEGAPDAAAMRAFKRFRDATLIPNTALLELAIDDIGTARLLCGAVAHLPPSLVTGGP